MAFKKSQPAAPAPDSPEKLLLNLPRRKIPGVLQHQYETINHYVKEGFDSSDVALQLPTGSGKTLVGLLIGEWRRIKNHERVVYLCPTKQLVNQVVEQAEDKYGLTVLPFVGKSSEYTPAAKAEYKNADRIAVTTYSSLFNTSPFFDDADILILEDAHAAENYIASLWSVRIEKNNPEHSALYQAISNILKPILAPMDYARLTGDLEEGPYDRFWIDKIPTPEFSKIANDILVVLDEHAKTNDLSYSWSMIRDHILACQLYISYNEILLRPLIPPTWTHHAFASPKQRIYMSATLGAGGDLERLTGRKSIKRLPIPEGWNRQGVGRRFFIFPTMSLGDAEIPPLRRELMKHAGRSLVLVPNNHLRDEVVTDVKENLKGFEVLTAEDIVSSTKPFSESENAVAVVSNRYDGIDLPGPDCRLLFVEGLPRATNLQERFIMSRMGSTVLFNERIQTRILQAIGRCTRSLEDYSAIVVSGEELPDYLADHRRRKFFHPELQAELAFGTEQSRNIKGSDLIDNFDIFLENGPRWEEVNQQIVADRERAVQEPFPAMDQLAVIVGDEIEFQEKLWQGDFESALASAKKVLGGLAAPELMGYRALWYYLAGSAAWLGSKAGVRGLAAEAREQFSHAKKAAIGIPWLVQLARYESDSADTSVLKKGSEQIERIEVILTELGTTHDRAFARREKEILEGLQSKDARTFELAHKKIGQMLGFESGKKESEGSPDPWWITEDLCLVFEDHSNAEEQSDIDVTKARQVSSHPAWMIANVPESKNATILPVLVTPVKKVRAAAMPHLQGVAIWPLKDFLTWSQDVLSVIREIRKTFVEPGDIAWRKMAIEALEQKKLEATLLFAQLQSQKPENILTVI